MTGAIARILLRYIGGALVAKGILGPDHANALIGDPDVMRLVETGLGLAASAAAEGWYWAAKRFGWRT